jgi:uncharacterized membrane protein YedE/YeeE
MDHFTPFTAIGGGALIGLASAVLWLGNGRIAGISGLFGQAVPVTSSSVWRVIFLVALVAGAFAAAAALPGLGVGRASSARPAALVEAPEWFAAGTPVWLIVAGLLVGVGTKLSNGCTSGHGVCGIARLSPRSFAAVGTFFIVAIITVSLTGIV